MDKFNIEDYREKIAKSAIFIKDQVEAHFGNTFQPRVLIICGSGLGGITNRVATYPVPLKVPYAVIPGFKVSTVFGHEGSLLFGEIEGTPVVVMSGRLHGYEGHTIYDTVFPIRALHEFSQIATMGSLSNLIVTNAAGATNPDYTVCDLMCIIDHINIPGLAGAMHPLKGPNMDEYGPRFLALSDAYDLDLRRLLFQKQKELNIERKIHEGTYTFVSGPTFESRAEVRMIKAMGGDAVGMSTVPEVIVARHCGWKVLAMSLITNECVSDPPASVFDIDAVPLDKSLATHAEVLLNGTKASGDVEALVQAVVSEL
ncbi:hypothetical protein TPHA_0F02880 [Tetrapisispora phaffii CBS 4417]|uniref:Purine nucleoside phosphorylase n=1 Tax=Tetrapisispora phaffii (strain ATCC 24235 / CBS 4417 / NBRC 1672 / NRRL Y-8282 / UCD 70-5) TaxID=1071381 RepID=G8BUI3_TETPH|nr:hypothetical protein TPHA_0F02880 [Tetrapisispora phaffii CBS 4417]CCE63769.1 hypothetical protein TPHA_0F02880 [Tetrapisispora phaffii CBS 4417]